MSKEKIDPNEVKFRKTGLIMLIGLVVLILGLNIGREYFPWRYYSIYIMTSEKKMPLESGNLILFQGNKVGYIKEVNPHKEGIIIHSKFKQKFQLPNAININVLDDNKMNLKIMNKEAEFWVEGDTVVISD